MSKILVFAETHEQVIKNVSFEILSHLDKYELDYVFKKRTKKLLDYFHSLPKIETFVDNELKHFE